MQNVLKMSCVSPILCLGDKALIGKSILDDGGGGKEGRPKVVLQPGICNKIVISNTVLSKDTTGALVNRYDTCYVIIFVVTFAFIYNQI